MEENMFTKTWTLQNHSEGAVVWWSWWRLGGISYFVSSSCVFSWMRCSTSRPIPEPRERFPDRLLTVISSVSHHLIRIHNTITGTPASYTFKKKFLGRHNKEKTIPDDHRSQVRQTGQKTEESYNKQAEEDRLTQEIKVWQCCAKPGGGREKDEQMRWDMRWWWAVMKENIKVMCCYKLSR